MAAKLVPGSVVQYRRVGQARLVARRDDLAEPQDAESGRGWWSVEWIKAPKRYREESGTRMYWIEPRDLVEE